MKRKILFFISRFGLNAKPKFLIIGAQKAGTTALFSILNQHSLTKRPTRKEIGYFSSDAWYKRGRLNQYHAFFPLTLSFLEKKQAFEATPEYLYHQEVPKRLHAYNPNLKLIIVLRNPVERAFSAWTMYHHHFKTGSFRHLHDPRSFSEAVSDEIKPEKSKTSYPEDRIAYVKRGLYQIQIENYLKFFPASQILILESKELKNDFDAISHKIQDFLALPYEELKPQESNKSKKNDSEIYGSEIELLKDFYKPYNEKLFQFLGRRFDWE